MKNKANVEIAGRIYTIVGEESSDYLYRVGAYVQEKIEEIRQVYPTISTADAAVLAATNITDELLKLRDEHDALDERISRALGSVSAEDEPLNLSAPHSKKHRQN